MAFPMASSIAVPGLMASVVAKPLMNTSYQYKPVICSTDQKPITIDKVRASRSHPVNPLFLIPDKLSSRKGNGRMGSDERNRVSKLGGHKMMMVLGGFGYWVQGFRCFPWLALNFHMAENLSLCPATLQLVQNSGSLPMIVKPLYGILSDVVYVGNAHRIPYIAFGASLQVAAWATLGFVPAAGSRFPVLMACILFSNLGASITEVALDALAAEYGQSHDDTGLQSFSFTASAAGGILGNLIGGLVLLKTIPRSMFFIFACTLFLQLAVSLTVKEDSLGLPRPRNKSLAGNPLSVKIAKKFSELFEAVNDVNISRPLIWVVTSMAIVPLLNGSVFCYQTQCLGLEPSVIGMSKVIGQLMLLSASILYNRFWRTIPMRKLIGTVQVLYASSLLLDLVLVRQINLKLGISNEVFSLCFSGFSETIAQFKLLPFSVLFVSLCPRGCEATLIAFLASAFCFSSIVSGFLGVGLASGMGITSGNYSCLDSAIAVQVLAALIPLKWISKIPSSQTISKRKKRRRVWRNKFSGDISFKST